MDILSYLGNIYVERVKRNNPGEKLTLGTKLCINVYIPVLSILSLVAVTIYVTIKAINVLKSNGSEEEDDLKVAYLYGFSSSNLVINLGDKLIFLKMIR